MKGSAEPLGFRGDDRYRSIPEDRILAALKLAGWAFEFDSAAANEGSRLALQQMIGAGLPFRTGPDGGRFFDPIEVNNFTKLSAREGRTDFFPAHQVPTGQRLVSDLAAETNSGPERTYVVEFRRRFNLEAIPPGTKLRLRCPLPLAGDYLKNIDVKPIVETPEPAQAMLSPGRLEVRTVAGNRQEITIGAILTATLRSPAETTPGRPDSMDRNLYLNEREGLIVVTTRIRDFARQLAGKDSPPLEALRSFWAFIHRDMFFGSVHYELIDAERPCDWLLDHGWFDCNLGSALLAALCRAHGIPARIVGGFMLYRKAPLKHYWLEAWLDDRGWMPLDLTSWDISNGGQDERWRDHYFGKIDHRIVCERMPRDFTGVIGVSIPAAWSMVQLGKEGGVEADLVDLNGRTVYADLMRIVA